MAADNMHNKIHTYKWGMSLTSELQPHCPWVWTVESSPDISVDRHTEQKKVWVTDIQQDLGIAFSFKVYIKGEGRGVSWPRAASAKDPWGRGTAHWSEGREGRHGSEPGSSLPHWLEHWESVSKETITNVVNQDAACTKIKLAVFS